MSLFPGYRGRFYVLPRTEEIESTATATGHYHWAIMTALSKYATDPQPPKPKANGLTTKIPNPTTVSSEPIAHIFNTTSAAAMLRICRWAPAISISMVTASLDGHRGHGDRYGAAHPCGDRACPDRTVGTAAVNMATSGDSHKTTRVEYCERIHQTGGKMPHNKTCIVPTSI
jgi:hypothetical protein